MKKIILSLLLVVLISFNIPGQFMPAQYSNISLMSIQAQAETVIYNTKTGKYHKPSCSSAKRCTVNCVSIDKSEAIKKGGIPCKKCGG